MKSKIFTLSLITLLALSFNHFARSAAQHALVFAQPVYAQDTIELNIGEEAVTQNLPGTANTDPEAPGGGFALLIGSLMSVSMTIGAVLVLFYLIWGAIEWVTAGGESGKLEKARQKITQSVIGLIVLSSVTAIFMFLQQFLNICVLPFFGACSVAADGAVSFVRVSGDYNPGNGSGGTGGGNGGGNGGGGPVCTPSNTKYNDGGTGNYCTQGAAIVQCNGPDSHPSGSYTYNHFDPCDCVDGPQYQRAAYDFDSC